MRTAGTTQPVALNVTGTDATSGVDVVHGADLSAALTERRGTVSGTCTDGAGNMSDSGDPPRSSTTRRADGDRRQWAGLPNANGWYRAPADDLVHAGRGGRLRAGPVVHRVGYAGPDEPRRRVSGTCTDVAGNTSALAGPRPSSTTRRRRPPRRSWTGRPTRTGGTTSPVALGVLGAGCNLRDRLLLRADVLGAGRPEPDDHRLVHRPGREHELERDRVAEVRRDAPDGVRLARARPGRGGWYNQPVAFALNGTDATSGIASCAGGYGGPDGTSRTASGNCTDVAGNPSGPVTATINYDATPPVDDELPGSGPGCERLVQPAGLAERERVRRHLRARLVLGRDLLGSGRSRAAGGGRVHGPGREQCPGSCDAQVRRDAALDERPSRIAATAAGTARPSP